MSLTPNALSRPSRPVFGEAEGEIPSAYSPKLRFRALPANLSAHPAPIIQTLRKYSKTPMIVTDSAGNNDGYALGDPIWQSDGGKVNGALQLDGVDDYVITGAAPNPEKRSYSIIVWIKGSAPGQVVLSQMGKANWLGTDPSAGALMTELTISGRNGSSLSSPAVITDGNWHRIGFVWDGSFRRLYVDGVIAAEDVQDNLDISSNGLYFGTGKSREPGTYFFGLIDDIRIYNRAVSP